MDVDEASLTCFEFTARGSARARRSPDRARPYAWIEMGVRDDPRDQSHGAHGALGPLRDLIQPAVRVGMLKATSTRTKTAAAAAPTRRPRYGGSDHNELAPRARAKSEQSRGATQGSSWKMKDNADPVWKGGTTGGTMRARRRERERSAGAGSGKAQTNRLWRIVNRTRV